MFYYLFLPFTLFATYVNQGGYVLIVLFIVALYMWILLTERFFFYKYLLKDEINESFISYQNMITADNWTNQKIKKMFLAEITLSKNKNINQIKGLVALCPLLGLLGTVTGMIEADVGLYRNWKPEQWLRCFKSNPSRSGYFYIWIICYNILRKIH